MNIYNAIYIIEQDNDLVAEHVTALDALGEPIEHCLYYGLSETPPKCWKGRLFVNVGCQSTRDNMALKTYGILKHALTIPNWTHLFKTDCNVTVTKVNWGLVHASDYAGCVIGPTDGQPSCDREYKNAEREPLLREPWLGTLPLYWCRGSAYFVSRKLAQLIVDRGAWAARGHFAEDIMVANVAHDHGIVPTPAVTYFDNYGKHGPDSP